MKRVILSLALLSLVVGTPAGAVVPSTMSHQGVLTDGAGNIVPDGNYDLTFRIFDVSAGGAALWTEAHVGVPVTLGGYSLILGSITPLSLAFDKQYWLEVQVGGDPPLAPRIALASSPYGLSLRLPFAQTTSSASPLISLDNTGTGADIRIGSATNSGIFEHFMSGGAVPSLVISGFGSLGSQLDMLDELGNPTIRFEPDVTGEGGFLIVHGSGGNSFFVDGNSDGAGNPLVGIWGTPSASFFNTAASGDGSVTLPADAVAAPEILNEAGVAQEKVDGDAAITDETAMADVVVLDVTIPAPGYITLVASAQHRMSGTTSGNYVSYQIDETAGGSLDFNHYFYSGFSTTSPSGVFWMPVSTQRTYFKAAAGTYQFRLEARKETSTGSSAFWNPTLTAFYLPTSYGTVKESVSPLEAADFQDVRRVQVGDNGGAGAGDEVMVVDLRELEVRAARLRAEAERAELELLRARMESQKGAGTETVPAGGE